jgi:uncharacterized phosphosugar-binding protein
MLAKKYLNKIYKLSLLLENQLTMIEEVDNKIAECIIDGGIIHNFGSGHSDIVAKEITGRAGGLVPINKIIDPMEGKAERIEGYTKVLLDEYAKKYGIKEGEFIKPHKTPDSCLEM